MICDDCKRESEATKDTMVGHLCPECYAAWIGAARGLLVHAAEVKALRAGGKVGTA